MLYCYFYGAHVIIIFLPNKFDLHIWNFLLFNNLSPKGSMTDGIKFYCSIFQDQFIGPRRMCLLNDRLSSS